MQHVVQYSLPPAVPGVSTPKMETLALLCGGDEMKAELWEELGTSLGMSKEQLEKISVEEGDNLEKCKQCVLNVRKRLAEYRNCYTLGR